MNNTENEALKVRSNNHIIFTVVVIILFVLSISYIAFYQLDLFQDGQKTSGINDTTDKDIFTKSNIPIANDSNLIVGNDTIKDISSTNTDDVKNFNEQQTTPKLYELSNHHNLPEKPTNNLPPQDINSAPIWSKEYCNYLLHINLLIANFLQGKTYTEQLSKITRVELPLEIKNILEDLLNYHANYLFNNNTKTEKIFPATSSWLEKFIKIEKKPLPNKDQEILKQRIMRQLDFFINFFYSQKFQQKFIEQNNV